ncbi:MAG TPA: sulfotransferase [Acetobacteraceae bacterium]|nr:sulfotransferase [Acetobacteraceae bacterium]HEX4368882.1 sulfotransferase [Rhodopila sp.]
MRFRQEIQALPRQACLRAISAEALTAPILVLGAPRSGTTWLAKIIDSHPDVLYRHEPDETIPAPSPLTPDALPALLARWATETGARTVTKQPYFRKSWQPGWALGVRTGLAAAVGAASRMPPPFKVLGGLRIPDLAARPAPRIAIKSVRWAEGAATVARSLPDSRTIFILRHPCGQVASVMRGNRQRRFDLTTGGTDMPFDEVGTLRFAASFGLTEPDFQALPDAAKYAWSWRFLNEPAYAALAAQSNVQVVLYEALCSDPSSLVRRILKFANLDWDRQTEAFVARSTSHQGKAGYHAIFRNAVAAAEAWRGTMAPADQDAVRSVASASPLARFWPDLMDAR